MVLLCELCCFLSRWVLNRFRVQTDRSARAVSGRRGMRRGAAEGVQRSNIHRGWICCAVHAVLVGFHLLCHHEWGYRGQKLSFNNWVCFQNVSHRWLYFAVLLCLSALRCSMNPSSRPIFIVASLCSYWPTRISVEMMLLLLLLHHVAVGNEFSGWIRPFWAICLFPSQLEMNRMSVVYSWRKKCANSWDWRFS